MYQEVPANEIDAMTKAIAEGRCATCYAPILPKDGGFYCHECDPRDTEKEPGSATEPTQDTA